MSDQGDEIRKRIRDQLAKYLPKDTPIDSLSDGDPLVSAGLLDSVAALKLVDHLEETYDIEFDPEELSAEYLDTVAQITQTVIQKKEGG